MNRTQLLKEIGLRLKKIRKSLKYTQEKTVPDVVPADVKYLLAQSKNI